MNIASGYSLDISRITKSRISHVVIEKLNSSNKNEMIEYFYINNMPSNTSKQHRTLSSLTWGKVFEIASVEIKSYTLKKYINVRSIQELHGFY